MLWTGDKKAQKAQKGIMMMEVNEESKDLSKASESLSGALAIFADILEQRIAVPLKKQIEEIKDDEYKYRLNVNQQWIMFSRSNEAVLQEIKSRESQMIENQANIDEKLREIQSLVNSSKEEVSTILAKAKEDFEKLVNSSKENMQSLLASSLSQIEKEISSFIEKIKKANSILLQG